MPELFSITELSATLGLSSVEHRALREGARFGALGAPVETYARAQYFGPDLPYLAALFMAIHGRLGLPARIAAPLVADANDRTEAIAAFTRGERWRFELQYLAHQEEPFGNFAPWGVARSGLPTTEIPWARTIVDLNELWGFLK